jgi:hypothetical protein
MRRALFVPTCFSALICLALVPIAEAAPATPGPAPTPTPTLRPGISPNPEIKMKVVDVDLAGAVGKCGETYKQRVLLKNLTGKVWSGTVRVTIQGAAKEVAVENLHYVGLLGQRTVDVPSTNPLDCSKPLGTIDVRVSNEGAKAPFFSNSLKPTTVKAEQGFPAVPSNDPSPWLRRVTLNGTCGGTITGAMGLHVFSSTPKPAKVKLALGSATKEETVQVATTNTFVQVESPLDCQAAALPVFDYSLLEGHPANGKLKVVEVNFEP